jgi:hypothetical protein
MVAPRLRPLSDRARLDRENSSSYNALSETSTTSRYPFPPSIGPQPTYLHQFYISYALSRPQIHQVSSVRVQISSFFLIRNFYPVSFVAPSFRPGHQVRGFHPTLISLIRFAPLSSSSPTFRSGLLDSAWVLEVLSYDDDMRGTVVLLRGYFDVAFVEVINAVLFPK